LRLALKGMSPLKTLKSRHAFLTESPFTGHGGNASFGPVNDERITQNVNGLSDFLEWIKSKKCVESEIILNHCSVAEDDTGREFIQRIADITQYNVQALDDWYAIWPYGKWWEASPGSDEVEMIHDTGDVYDGSWVQWFATKSGKPPIFRKNKN